MSMNVVIATEGGNDIGFGHLTRCVSLYQAFEEKGITPKLVVNGDESVKDLFTDVNYSIFDWLDEKERVFDIINGADIAIIDSYLADLEFYKEISNVTKMPVYIDDNRRINYPKGVVINGNIYAEELDYPRRKDVAYLLGSRYVPLRKEFWHIPRKKINQNLEKVLIFFGGEDKYNMTPKMLHFLNVNYAHLKKHIIISRAFHNLADINKELNKNVHLIYSPDARKVKEEMLGADIALSAGGQSLYELARIGLSTIGICLFDNQKRNLESWHNTEFVVFVGRYNDTRLFDKIKEEIQKSISYSNRIKQSNIGKTIVDGQGAFRIVNTLTKEAKIFSRL